MTKLKPGHSEELLSALERCVDVIGHNSVSDGNQPNGFVVALEYGRAALKHAHCWQEQYEDGPATALVNAHGALVEACESALSLLTEYRERVIKGRITGDLVPGDYEPVAQLRAALALAKEVAA